MMEEFLAFGQGIEDFPDELKGHLKSCQDCESFYQESLLLNDLLEEPLAFPPPDLVSNVMQRIASEEAPPVRLPWGERLAWAISGALAMYCAEHIPEYSSSWLTNIEQIFLQTGALFQAPMALSATSVLLSAICLFMMQGALVYKTRTVI